MRRQLSIITTLTVCLAGGAAKAELSVESWRLLTGLSTSSTQEFVAFEQVQNPFQAFHEALLDQSHVNSFYDFSWTGDSGSFDIDVTHFLMELDGDIGTSGRITVRPSVDSIIAFDAFFDFSWPSEAIGGSALGFGVIDLATQKGVITDTDSGGNVGLGPPFGTLNVSGSALLLADGQYEILYNAFIDHFTPTPPGTHGDGSGNIHFSITPVPEPATASLLLAGLLAYRARRAPRRRPWCRR